MKIRLHLGPYCIETAMRRQYSRLLAEYFHIEDAGARARSEKQIDLIGRALPALDFGRLRSRFKALAGGSDPEVWLAETADGRLELIVDGCIVQAFKK
ncbi:MAG: hypothetical protein JJV98_10980 [Desulfosarcina sp.]|nr:hypothetical protein [Desulfobacterales bacterium]